MTVSVLVNERDKCFVNHLLEPVTTRCFTEDLSAWGSIYHNDSNERPGRSLNFSIFLPGRLFEMSA